MKIFQVYILLNATVLCWPSLSERQRDQIATERLVSRMRKQLQKTFHEKQPKNSVLNNTKFTE